MLGFHFIAGILFILGKVQKYMRQLMSSGSNKVACRIIARLHQWRGLEAELKNKEKEKCFFRMYSGSLHPSARGGQKVKDPL